MADTCDARPDPRRQIIRRIAVAITLLCALQPSAAFADDPPTQRDMPPSAADWQPAPGEQASADWIRLGSGEWLKGRIRRLRRETLEFKSEDLKDLVLDWEKVDVLYSPLPHTYLFDDMQAAKGPASMRGEGIQIESAQGIVERPRKELLTIVPGGNVELDYWDGKLSANLSLTRGNTRQTEIGGYGFVRRTGVLSRFRIDYQGNLSRVDGSENENKHRVGEKYDLYVSRHVFVTPIQFEALVDRFQNIKVRATPSLSLGYQFFDLGDLYWSANLGGGFQYTRFDSTPAGETQNRYRGTIIFSTRLESELSKRVDLDANFSLGLPVPKVNEAIYHFFGILSLEITDIFDLDLSFSWDRTENPEITSDGTRPKPDDFRTAIGIGAKF